jgi:hypothetical protein
MRGFLSSTVTGCAFAAAHAPEVSDALHYAVHVGPLDEDLTANIESALDTAAQAREDGQALGAEMRELYRMRARQCRASAAATQDMRRNHVRFVRLIRVSLQCPRDRAGYRW